MKYQPSQSRAMVLIVVVYIVATLSALAFALSFRSRIAIKSSVFLIEKIRQDKIANAICVQACRMLTVDDQNVDSPDEIWAGRHKFIPPDVNGWEAVWKLIDESSKININLAYSDMLLKLKCLDEATVASVLDWLDQDDIPNPDGAEDNYYVSLEPGYNCKNGAIDNIAELLLIKGVSPQIYYGSNPTGEENSLGLNNLLTIYGDGKININTASKTVLDAIPLLCDAAVDEIVLRQTSAAGKFSSMDDIEKNDNFTAADKLTLMQIAKFNSNHFQIQIKIRNKTQNLQSQYLAIIERKDSNTKILSWRRRAPALLKDKTILTHNIYLQE